MTTRASVPFSGSQPTYVPFLRARVSAHAVPCPPLSKRVRYSTGVFPAPAWQKTVLGKWSALLCGCGWDSVSWGNSDWRRLFSGLCLSALDNLALLQRAMAAACGRQSPSYIHSPVNHWI